MHPSSVIPAANCILLESPIRFETSLQTVKRNACEIILPFILSGKIVFFRDVIQAPASMLDSPESS
jgi:hypothetical protein